MAIPYHRYVRYTDDGCGIQECLSCKAAWEWRGGSGVVRFCMYCGVEFEGELECRDHDTPRWQYDLERRIGKENYWKLERQWQQAVWARMRKKRVWVIEERSFWLRDDSPDELLQDWHKNLVLTHADTAHEAYPHLLRVRKQEDDRSDPDYDPEADLPPRFTRSEFRLRRRDG